MKARKIRREKTKEEDESKTCPICSKSFVNGKALGGHLRSHFAKHPLTPAPEPDPTPPPTGSRVLPNRSFSLLEPAPDRRRSARANRARARANSAEPSWSHDSGTLSEEDGALCLMLLSRDSWTRKSGAPPRVTALRPEELYECGENDVLGGKTAVEEEEGVVDLEPGEYVGYECEVCNKVFESEAEHRRLRLSSCGVKKCSAKLSSITIDLNRLPL